ncbi:MAG: GAF domain-containing sensor histidine kinase [Cyanobacteria bacterium]|nr:GAF domain-containing sensor histidine kinase [Cyanobacteriota bacterium]
MLAPMKNLKQEPSQEISQEPFMAPKDSITKQIPPFYKMILAAVGTCGICLLPLPLPEAAGGKLLLGGFIFTWLGLLQLPFKHRIPSNTSSQGSSPPLHPVFQPKLQKEDPAQEALLIQLTEDLMAQDELLTKMVKTLTAQKEQDLLIQWLSKSIRNSLNLSEVLEKTNQEIAQLFQVDTVAIYEFIKPSGLYQPLNTYQSSLKAPSSIALEISSEYPETEILENRFCANPMCMHHQTIIQNHAPLLPTLMEGNEAIFKPFEFEDAQSFIKIPLVDQNGVLGALCIQQRQFPRQWRQAELEILTEIGDTLVIALKQAKLYEAAQVSSQAKSQFLANVSHELRTPLNAIIGFSEMLKNQNCGPLTTEQEEYLGYILTSGEHLLTLMNDLLDLSKAESGHLTFHYGLVNIPALLQETQQVVQGLAFKKNIHISTHIHPGVYGVYGDPVRLKQVIYNLYSNAIKFSPPDGTISVTAFLKAPHSKSLMIEIQDSGVGIDSDEIEFLFNPFQQGNRQIKRSQQGTGLGLSLSRKLMELMGGSLSVKPVSQVGSPTTATNETHLSKSHLKGACFQITLPQHISNTLPGFTLSLKPDKPFSGSLKNALKAKENALR